MYQQLSILGKKIKAAWGVIFQGEASTELQNNLAEKVKSNDAKEVYGFTFLFNRIREWLDEASFDTGKTYDYEIKNKKWQEGFDIDQDYVDDVKANAPLASDLQTQLGGINSDFVDHKDELLNDLLVDGTSGLAFDDTEFFANARPNIPDTSTIDNLYAGTGITLATIEADLEGARDQLKSFRIKGKPVNKNAKIVVTIPTQLFGKFNTLRTAENIEVAGVSKTNDAKDTFEIVENYDQDTTNNDWYVSNKGSKMKPLIIQERSAVEFKELKDEFKDLVLFNWKARYNAGYGNPMAIVKVDNA